MSNNFLLSGIGLGPRVAVVVGHCPRVIPGFVVVALRIETEVTLYFPDILIL